MIFNKKKCRKCKYHGTISLGSENIFCAYSLHTEETNLKRKGNKIVDTRGYNPNDCQNFKAKGKNTKPKKVDIVLQ